MALSTYSVMAYVRFCMLDILNPDLHCFDSLNKIIMS